MRPQRFEIVVKGRLSTALESAVDGFEVISVEGGQTHLEGWVTDQAKLHGTLETLASLNIELISINPIIEDETIAPEG
ncbi:MAG: hypothetical protein ABWX59_09220 [Microbacteriaceae bacterium]